MSLFHHNALQMPLLARPALLQSLQHAWSTHRADAARRSEINSAVAELSAFDDLQLADLGIARSSILSAVTHPDERKGH